MTDKAQIRLAVARRQREQARAILRTDLATLRTGATGMLVAGLTDKLRSGAGLVRDHSVTVTVGAAGACGWLFRKPLGALVYHGVTWAKHAIARRRG